MGFNAYASPAIVDGTVYIGGKSAYALDAADGTEQWTHEFSYLTARRRQWPTAPSTSNTAKGPGH